MNLEKNMRNIFGHAFFAAAVNPLVHYNHVKGGVGCLPNFHGQ